MLAPKLAARQAAWLAATVAPAPCRGIAKSPELGEWLAKVVLYFKGIITMMQNDLALYPKRPDEYEAIELILDYTWALSEVQPPW